MSHEWRRSKVTGAACADEKPLRSTENNLATVTAPAKQVNGMILNDVVLEMEWSVVYGVTSERSGHWRSRRTSAISHEFLQTHGDPGGTPQHLGQIECNSSLVRSLGLHH